eukprot:g1485.t1
MSYSSSTAISHPSPSSIVLSKEDGERERKNGTSATTTTELLEKLVDTLRVNKEVKGGDERKSEEFVSSSNEKRTPPSCGEGGRFSARKIVDKINEKKRNGQISTSFEFFPAKTEKGTNNLLSRIHNMHARLQPTFVTLTWRSAFKDENLWIKIGSTIQNEFNVEVLMHLTCHLPIVDLKRILENCKKAGLRNILALRGDPPIGEERWKRRDGCLNNAVELVQLIRKEHGDYFCIAVAGYPESHIETWNSPHLPPSAQCRALDIDRLKMKIDAGADFVISQFFFDVSIFLQYRNSCQACGLGCPILPGYLPIQNYKSYRKFTTWCKTHVPTEVVSDLEAIKDNDQAVKAYGIDLAIKTQQELIRNGCRALHFYTMNLSLAVTKILQGLNLVSKKRALPWKMPQRGTRGGTKEEVRPIFWSQRPLSYISRTRSWGEFPNGRWGDADSPAYGELTDYYLAFKRKKKADVRLKQWGVPQCDADINDFFRRVVTGEVTCTPWSDEPMSRESSLITDQLELLNSRGFLTINSQPRVNAAPSDDKRVGWGPSGGYVFQKAYVEFFTSPELFRKLLTVISEFPSLAYHAINKKGDEFTNVKRKKADTEPVTAVTWGVFPGREVVQPTVVDPSSFRAWKDEAFELWLSQWASIYQEDTVAHRKSKEIVRRINSTYFLVNIVDNDYTNAASDIFAVFKRLIAESMSVDDLRSHMAAMEKKILKLRKKFQSAEELRKDCAVRLKRSEEECATLLAENRTLKAKIDFESSMRARAYS